MYNDGRATLALDDWSALTPDDWANLPVNPGALRSGFGGFGQKQYYLDPETQLYLLGSGVGGRHYDPATGQFISEDSLRHDAGDYNLRRYVGNNPITRVDPSGTFFLPDAGFSGASSFTLEPNLWSDASASPGNSFDLAAERSIGSALAGSTSILSGSFSSGRLAPMPAGVMSLDPANQSAVGLAEGPRQAAAPVGPRGGYVYDDRSVWNALVVDYGNITLSPWVARVGGISRTAFGLAETAAGLGASSLGIGVPVTVHGADVTWAGLRQMYSGVETSTYTSQGIAWGAERAGASQQAAHAIGGFGDAAISITGWTAASMNAARTLSQGAVAMRLNPANYELSLNGVSQSGSVVLGANRLPVRYVGSSQHAMAAAERAGVYEVGLAKNLRSNPFAGTQVNHAPMSRQAELLIGNWSPVNKMGYEPAIRLPTWEHEVVTAAQAARMRVPASARELLADEIRILRNNTKAPTSALQKLIDLNLKTHPTDYLPLHRSFP